MDQWATVLRDAPGAAQRAEHQNSALRMPAEVGQRMRRRGRRRAIVLSGHADSWPGRAPCWRHEEFPYLTVAQVVDAAAGTRVCGRRCFAMETVSATVGAGSDDDVRSGTLLNPEADTVGGDARAMGRGEVQFPDDMWRAVMSGAALAGDERWVIGENGAGNVSVVRF